MALIPIIIIALATGLLVFLLLSFSGRKKTVGENPADTALSELEAKKNHYNTLEGKLFDIVERNFDRKYVQEIKSGEISTGMPVECLLMSWGHPVEIREELRAGPDDATWIYKQIDPKVRTRFTEVRVLDKKVQGWKDI